MGSVGGRLVLATGSDDTTVRLWDPVAGAPLGEPLTGHTGPVQCGVCGSVGGQPVLATGSDDTTVRLWDPVAGAPLGEPLTGHTGPVQWGVWGSVGGRPLLATGDARNMVQVWDPVAGEPLGAPLTGPALWGAWGSIDGQPVLATGDARGVRLWDPVAGEPLTGHTGPSQWGVWGSVDGRPVLATGSDDTTVRLWDPIAAAPFGEPLTGHTGPLRWGVWGSVDGRPVLATGSDDTTVRLWEVIEDRPVSRLPFYRSDTTAATDELTRAGDAIALAELITARTARPPLAVGLFGDWGEGKSHFLGLLQQQVTLVARPNNPLAHSAVRQVRFNAWHYAETDLWASLVAELFAQLAASPDGDLGAEQRRQSRLAAELVAERGVRERLQVARGRRDRLQQALRQPVGPWRSLSEDQRMQLRVLAGDRPEQVYEEAARTAAALGETGRASWRFIRGIPLGTVAGLLSLILASIAVAVAVAWGLPALWRWFAALPSIAGLLVSVHLVLGFARTTHARANAAWNTALRFAAAQRLRVQTAAEVAAAEVNALERQVQNLTAAGQLAGLVGDRVAGADYRSHLGVMTQIREDFKHMAALLANAAGDPQTPTGPARAAVATPADADNQDGTTRPGGRSGSQVGPDAAGDRLPRIDRIILYIDDLDRCPPRRVVEMLEAIHLLLAVDLFVVVVAVDPRWLLRAIAAHYHDLLHNDTTPAAQSQETATVDPDDEELWRSTPAQYLEKIFQVVLTLPPLDTGGYQRLMRTLVGTRNDQSMPPPDAPNSPAAASTDRFPAATTTPRDAHPTAAETTDQDQHGPARDTGQEPAEAAMFGVRLPAARVVERVDPLTLDPDELARLDLLGPPLLVATPRAVKRLANSYGLLTAIRRGQRDADLAEQHATIRDPTTGNLRKVAYRPYRAGMVLLAALVAFPALGAALFLHLHHTAANEPDHTWAQLLEALQPHRNQGGHWSNPADPSMTPVQAQQWQALLHGLLHVGQSAAEHNLPLPDPLTAWAHWVVPVGRLSFPTGRIVNTLDRQRPLTANRHDEIS
ncbi:P-loop NTPase fold protein [Dactylosporangium sp. NPDC049140]|uniref:P-loop NTPase fold protein n=1 Tax=Dactylosporangium sp. NPDC049140 TaxID=3155647 RepID=UPI003405C2E2